MQSKKVSPSLVIFITLAIILVISGCEQSLEAPDFNNVFDNENASGNPLNLAATSSGTSIFVSWNQPQEQNITSYNIYHGLSYSTMDLDTNIVHDSDPTNMFIYNDPAPTETHYFRISALTNTSFSHYTEQTPAQTSTPPLVIVGDGDSQIASRYTPVTVTVNNGEFLIMADNPEFNNALIDTIVVDGNPQSIPWDFGTAEDNTIEKWLHFQAYNEFYTSPVDSIKLSVDFKPEFIVAGNPLTVARQNVDLEIPTDGLLEMRFANSELELETASWTPAAETYPGFELIDVATPQIIYGEFRGDFGFDQPVSITVTPELLTEATFYLALPEDHVTDDSQINAICAANATQMRFSESMDFAAATWEAYQDTVLIQLSPEAGRKIIYAQFRNEWADSPLLTDYVDYISQPAQVTFLAPNDGAILEGGIGFNIIGISSAASGTESVVGVELDTGNGAGYFALTGTDNWSHMWDVPVFEIDTEVILRARSFTATDTVNTLITVTVTGSVDSGAKDH